MSMQSDWTEKVDDHTIPGGLSGKPRNAEMLILKEQLNKCDKAMGAR